MNRRLQLLSLRIFTIPCIKQQYIQNVPFLSAGWHSCRVQSIPSSGSRFFKSITIYQITGYVDRLRHEYSHGETKLLLLWSSSTVLFLLLILLFHIRLASPTPSLVFCEPFYPTFSLCCLSFDDDPCVSIFLSSTIRSTL